MAERNRTSRSAAGSDTGAARSGTASRTDAAVSGVEGATDRTGSAAPGISQGGDVSHDALRTAREAAGASGGVPEVGASPSPEAGAKPALPFENRDGATAAAIALAEGRAEDAAREGRAAAGSALDAPSVGSGPAADPAVVLDVSRREALPEASVVLASATVDALGETGIAPGLYSREGAFGPDHELSRAGQRDTATRRLVVASEVRDAPYTGAKLAFPKPDDALAMADYRDAGFDLIVTSRQRNFRRAGVVHPVGATLRRSADFTVEELGALIDEPMLLVEALR